jgi:CheY-like chemotaxis protein
VNDVPAHEGDTLGDLILIVDDNAINAKLLSFILRRAGYAVNVAADSDEAFARLAELRPRLILMDMQLPGMDGYQLTRTIKADPTTRDIRIIALTAYAMMGDDIRAREAGCDDYVTKPIDSRSLRKLIAAYLTRDRGDQN